jgi:hypothetical protein
LSCHGNTQRKEGIFLKRAALEELRQEKSISNSDVIMLIYTFTLLISLHLVGYVYYSCVGEAGL